MEAWAIEILKTYGLAGVVIGFLAVAVWSQRKEIRELNAKLVDVAQKSATEAEALRNVIEGIIPVTEARNKTTEELVSAFSVLNAKFDSAVNEGRVQREIINSGLAALRGSVDNMTQAFHSLVRLDVRRRTP